MDKNTRIDSAADRFKQIANPDKYHYFQKFRSLPFWLEESSKHFMCEANHQLPNNYPYYKRGSVISVNFGVNEGSEFSNLHFAVVLDKRDSYKKRTLTVIPLTSKRKPNRLFLGKEIFNQTATIMLTNIRNLQEKNKILEKDNSKIEIKLDKLKKEVTQNEQEVKVINRKIDNMKSSIQDSPSNEEFVQLFELYNQFVEKMDELNKITSKINDLKNKSIEIYETTNEYSEQSQKLEKVANVYLKYNKNTFARIEDITTISKLRIHKINEFDPSGKIRLSSEQMKNISDKLMQLYITKN